MSPLLAQSGHALVHRTCPLSGVKRTCLCALQMSAFDPKRTSGRHCRDTALIRHYLVTGTGMKRREFITLVGVAATWRLVAGAPQPGKLPTVGFLGAATAALAN